MRAAVYLDRARLFRWHLSLVSALQNAGHTVRVLFRDGAEPLPTSLTAILDFDRVRAHSGDERLSQRMSPVAFEGVMADTDAAPDVTIDLSSAVRVKRLPGRVLRPHYDGSAKDYALFHALLAGRAPVLTVADTGSGGVWHIGLPALEQPTRLATSLDQTTSRLIEGLVGVIARVARGETPPAGSVDPIDHDDGTSILSATGTFAAHRTRSKIARVRDRLTRNQPKWHVAWRSCETDEPSPSRNLDLHDFRVLADDGARFYADPFVFEHEGKAHLFVEDLPAATGIGVISHTVLDDSGQPATPTPVLATGSHLSYPFVFARDGEIWMLPEQAAAGGLDLYRCRRFPDQWTVEARLMDGRFHDATLFEHGGRLWIAAGTEAYQSSTWDTLALFYADSLRGPWTAHPLNPVVMDARSARPAGPLWHAADGTLLRPAQDCTGGYGSRLTINRIVELTPSTFREEPVGTVAFAAKSGLLGPHTLVRAAGFELIDLYARASDLRAGYRN